MDHARGWTLCGVVGLLLAAGVVAARRLAGGFTLPLGTPAWCLAAGVAWAACLGLRWLWRHADGSRAPLPARLCVRLGPPLAWLVFAWAIALPGTPLAGVILFVALLAIEETWSIRTSGWDMASPPLARPVASKAAGAAVRAAASEEIQQEVVRGKTAAGADWLRARLHVDLAAGQRTATAHIAFCPPFDRLPQVEASQLAGPECRIKVALTLAHGLRLEVKRGDPIEEPGRVTIGVAARCDL